MPLLPRVLLAATFFLGTGCSGGDPAPSDAAATPTPAQTVASGDVAPLPARTAHPLAATGDSTVTVYKSPTCGCCRDWVQHMKDAGFTVVSVDTSDMNAVKHTHGVSGDIGSCHTALVGGYVLEGHVPAADVKRLLAERPAIVGLAVPGMPVGSPGMEGVYKQKYDVVAFDRTGGRSVFASY